MPYCETRDCAWTAQAYNASNPCGSMCIILRMCWPDHFLGLNIHYLADSDWRAGGRLMHGDPIDRGCNGVGMEYVVV